MLNFKIKTALALLTLFLSLQAFGQDNYTHFPWTFDRTLSAASGAEGTDFTFLRRSRPGIASPGLGSPNATSIYAALAVPIKPIRGAIGSYFHHSNIAGNKAIDFGLAYNFYLTFAPTAHLRVGVQQNWHRNSAAHAGDAKNTSGIVPAASTDFSALLRRDHLWAGISMENALHKEQRQYNILLGFRDLETYNWLRSSPFMLIQLYPDREQPEFSFNYTVTAFNTVVMGASVYKNGYYSWGANAGLKLFNMAWLTAGADFRQFNTQPDALELGLRLMVGKGGSTSKAEAAAFPRRLAGKGL